MPPDSLSRIDRIHGETQDLRHRLPRERLRTRARILCHRSGFVCQTLSAASRIWSAFHGVISRYWRHPTETRAEGEMRRLQLSEFGQSSSRIQGRGSSQTPPMPLTVDFRRPSFRLNDDDRSCLSRAETVLCTGGGSTPRSHLRTNGASPRRRVRHFRSTNSSSPSSTAYSSACWATRECTRTGGAIPTNE